VRSPSAYLLPEIIDAHVCIKCAWGDNTSDMANHQFLSPGATLKLGDNNKMTGMDADAFEKWEMISPQKAPVQTAAPD
jgi:hypothetical protein